MAFTRTPFRLDLLESVKRGKVEYKPVTWFRDGEAQNGATTRALNALRRGEYIAIGENGLAVLTDRGETFLTAQQDDDA